jgi:5-hydroxyisourate hydrolase-like protein (transthyretin family)
MGGPTGAALLASAAKYGGRVKAKWNMSENTAGGGDYTLQFGWTQALEDAVFRTDREENAMIYDLSDTTEAGTGHYTTQFITPPYTTSRAGIKALGPFAVGRFKDVTGVSEPRENAPVLFRLCQNYPNPFNPVTTVKFTLPEASHVKIVVYDILGRETATLVDAKLNAGDYTAPWNAVNNASGIYIYKLIAGDNVQARKMLLQK